MKANIQSFSFIPNVLQDLLHCFCRWNLVLKAIKPKTVDTVESLKQEHGRGEVRRAASLVISSLPPTQAVRGVLFVDIFKNNNKIFKSQYYFYYHHALAMLKIFSNKIKYSTSLIGMNLPYSKKLLYFKGRNLTLESLILGPCSSL